ncbi:MAG: polymerase sigma70 [Myxococcales bacterium]|nr:polymerase sigma70 [Myxococcales bacterium]
MQTMDVSLAAGGDRDAFARLVARHQSLVASIALGVVRDLDASEDVAQEVFLAVWRGLPKLRAPSSFLSWLRQLARNHAVIHLRRGKARSTLRGEAGDARVAAAIDPAPDAAAQLAGDEDRRALVEALEALPDDAREILTLYYREGRSAEQVAELLELRPDAVRKRLHRARGRLKDALAERMERVVRDSVPGAAFTATVMAAVMANRPAHAAGTALAAGKVLATGKVLAAGKAAGSLGAATAGPVAGLLFGWWLQWREAKGGDEKKGLIWFLFVNLALTASLPFLLVRVSSVAWVYGFLAAMAFTNFVWLPHIIRHRLAGDEGARRRFALYKLGGLAGLLLALGVTTVSWLAGW